MMSLWDALRMNMMISYQELVRTFPNLNFLFDCVSLVITLTCLTPPIASFFCDIYRRNYSFGG